MRYWLNLRQSMKGPLNGMSAGLGMIAGAASCPIRRPGLLNPALLNIENRVRDALLSKDDLVLAIFRCRFFHRSPGRRGVPSVNLASVGGRDPLGISKMICDSHMTQSLP
jgi:hypothetical protein